MNKELSDELPHAINAKNPVPDFQRARTSEQIKIRKGEIINACFKLYNEGGFEAVNFKAISEMTSFTRQSIYNYYKTREEVLLDMLLLENESWIGDLEKTINSRESMTQEEYARFISGLFLEHGMMLELTSLLINLLENSSRPERMAGFSQAGTRSYQTILTSVRKFFPELEYESCCFFTSSVIALSLGVYPVTQMYKKQILPSQENGFSDPNFIKLSSSSFDEMFYLSVLCLLTGLK